MLWIQIFSPESPHFLLKKERYDQLNDCLTLIAKMNKAYDKDTIDNIVQKLKKTAELDKQAKLKSLKINKISFSESTAPSETNTSF